MSQNKEDYIYASLEDVMRAISDCTDPDIKQELCRIYTNENYNELDQIRISKMSKVYSVMKQLKQEECSITIEDLSFALTRAMYECNHSIRNKLMKYIHQFLDNKKENKDNELLIYKIMNDKEIMNYIKKFASWEDYEAHLIQKQEQKQHRMRKQPDRFEEEKMKSFTIMN